MTKVLIIEDELNIRIFVTANLEVRGYAVLQADRGSEGLRLLRAENPDVVILDMLLPDMNGVDVLDHMTADDALSSIPVILMTASVNLTDLKDYPNLVQRLVKPVGVNVLLQTVELALHQE